MNKYIKLTSPEGHPVIIFVDHICNFFQTEDGVIVDMVGGQQLKFRYSADNIFKLIKEASDLY